MPYSWSFSPNMVLERLFRNALIVCGALLMLDDETLKSRGYSRADLRRKGYSGSYI